MHFDPSGAAGAARPRTFDDSHPHCLLYYLAYNDRKVQVQRTQRPRREARTRHPFTTTQLVLNCVLRNFPRQFFSAGCAFHFFGAPPENRNRRLQIQLVTVLRCSIARPPRHHAPNSCPSESFCMRQSICSPTHSRRSSMILEVPSYPEFESCNVRNVIVGLSHRKIPMCWFKGDHRVEILEPSPDSIGRLVLIDLIPPSCTLQTATTTLLSMGMDNGI